MKDEETYSSFRHLLNVVDNSFFTYVFRIILAKIIAEDIYLYLQEFLLLLMLVVVS
jgi:hypothetical protein